MTPGKWRPANNGVGKRIWFVCRDLPTPNAHGMRKEWHVDRNGKLIRYTRDGAYRKADELNGTAS